MDIVKNLSARYVSALPGLTMALFGFCAVALAEAGQFQREFSLVEEAAKQAQREGRDSISFGLIDHTEEPSDLRDILRGGYAVVVAVSKGLSVAQTVTPNWIASWHVFDLERRIASGAPGVPCPERPTTLELNASEVAVIAYGGTANVDGVRVTLTSGLESSWKVGSRYLLVGSPCGPHAMLAGGKFGPWSVGDDGALVPASWQRSAAARFPQLASLSSVEALLSAKTPSQ